MSEITDAQRKDLLIEIRRILPNAIYSKQGCYGHSIVFEDICGCYSDYTTEPCRFVVAIAGTLPEDVKEQVKLDKKLIATVESWVYSNLTWTGCSCCSGCSNEDCDGDDYISVDTRLYKIEEEERNVY